MKRYPVKVTYRKDVPGAVLLRFVDPCETCKRRHVHGDSSDTLDSDGTYGFRIAHCGFVEAPNYILVPE